MTSFDSCSQPNLLGYGFVVVVCNNRKLLVFSVLTLDIEDKSSVQCGIQHQHDICVFTFNHFHFLKLYYQCLRVSVVSGVRVGAS